MAPAPAPQPWPLGSVVQESVAAADPATTTTSSGGSSTVLGLPLAAFIGIVAGAGVLVLGLVGAGVAVAVRRRKQRVPAAKAGTSSIRGVPAAAKVSARTAPAMHQQQCVGALAARSLTWLLLGPSPHAAVQAAPEVGSRTGTPRLHHAIRVQATPLSTPRGE